MRHPCLPCLPCRRLLPLALAALLLSLPARAEPVDPVEAAMTRIAGRILSEQNFSLLFGLLRQSLAAAAEGKPAPELPAETAARLEATGKELQREMLAASVLVLDSIENDLRASLRNDLGLK